MNKKNILFSLLPAHAVELNAAIETAAQTARYLGYMSPTG